MRDSTVDPESRLLGAYQLAVVEFNTASARLILHLVAESLPTAGEVSAEEEARAAVVAARRNLWAAYGTVSANPAAASLPSRGFSSSASLADLRDPEFAPIG